MTVVKPKTGLRDSSGLLKTAISCQKRSLHCNLVFKYISYIGKWLKKFRDYIDSNSMRFL